MVSGIVVGIVQDNKDPDSLGRVLVKYPVESVGGTSFESHWCRMMTPFSGPDRGWVSLPDVGTEVVIAHATLSLQPYIVGAVFNGKDDTPEPYKNDDGKNNVRVFWSRNDHMLLFDDTAGQEKVALSAKAGTRLDPTSGVVYQELDASKKTYTEVSAGSTKWEAKGTVSIKCKDFKLTASNNVSLSAKSALLAAKQGAELSTQGIATFKGSSRVDINPSKPSDPAAKTTATPAAKHPPKT